MSPGDLDLAAVFAALPVATAVFAADPPRFTLLAVSEAFLAFAQRPRDALVGRPLAEVLAPLSPENERASGLVHLRASLAAAILTGEPQRMGRQRHGCPRPDGSREARDWDVLNVPVRGPDGAVRYVLHQVEDVTARVPDEARDVTERVRAEEALRLSEERLRLELTARKRAEEELRRSEKRQRFLVRLGDALRPLAEPAAVQDAAARVLGEHLEVSRAMYAEVEGEPGAEVGIIRGRYVADPSLPPFPEQYAYGGFGARVMPLRRRSETLVVADVTTDPRFDAEERLAWTARGVRAAITVALVKDGRFVADFGVQSATARAWTADEVTLVEDTAERTWAASERQRVEDALRANEERLRRALAIPTVGVLFFRLDGTIVDANGALQRMLGYSVEELRRIRDWSVLTPPEFDEVTERAARELAECGNTAPYEKQWRRKDGSRMWGLFAPTRLAGSGRNSECVEFIGDITRAKETEAALVASEARLNLAAQAKDEFLANLGHELRTPLAAITLWATVIRRTGPSSNLERGLDAIVASAAAQARLVDDLLDLSLVTTGRLRIAPTRVDPASVIRATADIVRPGAESKGLKLEIDVAANLEPLLLDAQRLRQVLWNLLSNAIKFTPPGGTVQLGVRRRDGALEVDVIDSGEGIAPEFVPLLFERFHQADMSDTRRHGGLGIGLALSRHIVELQAGTIEAHSDGIGHGSRFRVRLPWVHASGEATTVAKAAGAPEATLSGVHVMLVEDDEHTLKAMKLALEQAGAEVHDAPTARKALSLLETWHASGPQVVLVSDLHLPAMSGYELIERVAAARRARGQSSIPACAISAGSGSDDRQRAIAAGYDIFLPKPVEAAQLVEAVADLKSVGQNTTQ